MIYALKNKAYSHPPTTLQEVRHAVDDGLIVVTGGLHPGQSTTISPSELNVNFIITVVSLSNSISAACNSSNCLLL